VFLPQLGARQTEAAAAVLELQRLAADVGATMQVNHAIDFSLLPMCVFVRTLVQGAVGMDWKAIAHWNLLRQQGQFAKSSRVSTA
jgi:hypothetical protein